jgi:hypothetical protein
MLQEKINPQEEIDAILDRKYGIIDKRDGRVVISSNSWRIASEIFDNGYNFDKTPYKFERLA